MHLAVMCNTGRMQLCICHYRLLQTIIGCLAAGAEVHLVRARDCLHLAKVTTLSGCLAVTSHATAGVKTRCGCGHELAPITWDAAPWQAGFERDCSSMATSVCGGIRTSTCRIITPSMCSSTRSVCSRSIMSRGAAAGIPCSCVYHATCIHNKYRLLEEGDVEHT